jgi:hypothetical protein
MAMVEINWNPGARQLRQFAGLSAIALPALGWLWGGGEMVVGGLTLVGLAVAIAGTLAPATVKPLFLLLSLVAWPIGLVVGEVAILAIYGLVFVPMAIVFRLLGRDALRLRMDRGRPTYWEPKPPAKDAASYYRQF